MAKKTTTLSASKYPVYVHLATPNPYGGKVKVNNIEISYINTVITSYEMLSKLAPIAKYLVIEYPTETEDTTTDSTDATIDTTAESTEDTSSKVTTNETEN